MKRIIYSFIIFLIPLTTFGQKFYSIDDYTIGWKYWSSESDLNYLVNKGKKPTISCQPNYWTSSGFSMSGTNPDVYATFLIKNKFLLITFTVNGNILIRSVQKDSLWGNEYETKSYNIEDLYGTFSYMRDQSWFEIDFEKIVYDGIYDQIIIPCGKSNDNHYNTICLSFNTDTSVKESLSNQNSFDESNSKYYDIQGKRVDVNKVKNGIVIKSDGTKTKKFHIK